MLVLNNSNAIVIFIEKTNDRYFFSAVAYRDFFLNIIY